MEPFSKLTVKEKSVEVLRWICVLPAARLGDYLGYIVGATLGFLAVSAGIINPPSDDSVFNRFLRYLIWMLPEGIVCVIAGAMVAPRLRSTVAIVVGSLWMILTATIHRFDGPIVVTTALAGTCAVALVLFIERNLSRQAC